MILTESRENGSVPAVYSKKVLLKILDEIAEKADGEKPIEIDLTDSVKKSHFQRLEKKQCFAYNNDPQQAIAAAFGGTPLPLIGLSRKGRKYRSELKRELRQHEHDEHMRRQTKACEDAVCQAGEANRIARDALAEAEKSNAFASEANELVKGANCRSTVSMGVTIFCAIIAIPVFVDWFFNWLMSFFS